MSSKGGFDRVGIPEFRLEWGIVLFNFKGMLVSVSEIYSLVLASALKHVSR